VHFGLGPNQRVDLEVHWPSGLVDSFGDVGADGLYRITEGARSGQGTVQVVRGSERAISIDGATVGEGDGQARLILRLSSAVASPVSVGYATANGTAHAEHDYVQRAGRITFNPGVMQMPLAIDIVDDQTAEATEAFEVRLSDPIGAVLASNRATVTITDDDGGFPPDYACGAPRYNPTKAADRGAFLWRDCGATGSDRIWHLRVTAGGSSSPIAYGGGVTAAAGLSARGVLLEPDDLLETDATHAAFRLFVNKGGVDGIDLILPAESSACFDPRELPAGAAIMIGAGRHAIGTPFDLSTLGPCTAAGESDAACGMPDFKAGAAADRGAFLWRDCGASGPDEIWHLRVTAGGSSSAIVYAGGFTKATGLGTAGYWLERDDVLTADATHASFRFFVAKNGVDGMDLTLPSGTSACFDPGSLPAGATVAVGAGRRALNAPFDTATLASCTP
jgi:hypothetical protein